MSGSRVIVDKIREKEAEVQRLEDKLRTARVYLQALRDVLQSIDSGRSPLPRSDSTLRAGSSVTQAREAILRAGKPIHISDLLAVLGREVTRETRASLTSSLAAYARRGDVFTRPAPNTFGLVELGHTSEAPAVAAKLPPSFGKSSEGEDDEIPF